MTPLLFRALGGSIANHRWQYTFAIFGIAIGIAVVIAVDLAKFSALKAFDHATEALVGKARFQISGGEKGVPEALYTKLRVVGGIRRIAPRIVSPVRIPGHKEFTLQLVGIDPFAEADLASHWSQALGNNQTGDANSFRQLLVEPGAALLHTDTAKRLKLKVGDALELIVGGERRILRLRGLFSTADSGIKTAASEIIVTDIASAQEALGTFGRISQIDIYLGESPEEQQQLEKIDSLLPDGLERQPIGTAQQSLKGLSKAFYTNLSALSLLALIIGMFLIYNTMTFFVVRRRALFGRLRAIGVSSRQIVAGVFTEALILGIIGGCIGVVLGIGLAYFLTDTIAKTLSNVYFSTSTTQLVLSSWAIAKGVSLGLAAALLSALIPAIAAARAHPGSAMRRSALELHASGLVRICAVLGIAVVVIGSLVIKQSGEHLQWGFFGLTTVVIGLALLTPAAVMALIFALKPLVRRIPINLGQMPARSLVTSMSRTGVAIAALTIAVSATIGIDLMIGSFRDSVNLWLEQRLRADLYIASTSGAGNGIDLEFAKRVKALDGVAAISTVRRSKVKSRQGPIRVNAYTLVEAAKQGFQFKDGSAADIWPTIENSSTVIVSESFAFYHKTAVGSNLSLITDQGAEDFLVIGTYVDFNAGDGIVSMSDQTYRRYWNDDQISAVWVDFDNDIDAAKIRAEIVATFGDSDELIVTDNRTILRRSMEIFDQAFAITKTLRWLALLVAMIGIVSTLTTLMLDRIREFGTLRALGMTPRQLDHMIYAESILMGLIAGLLAIPIGYVIADILVEVINYRSYGWTIDLTIKFKTFWQSLGLTVLCAMLAGLISAHFIADLSPAEALKNE